MQFLDAGQLSGGQRKLLEFGMCFIEPPRVAMLDEPFAAVHPVMRDVMAAFIRTRHAQGATFLLVSHDMPIVVDLCQRAVCMNAGKVIAAGDVHARAQGPRGDRGLPRRARGGRLDDGPRAGGRRRGPR